MSASDSGPIVAPVPVRIGPILFLSCHPWRSAEINRFSRFESMTARIQVDAWHNHQAQDGASLDSKASTPKMQFPKPYERSHDVVENKGRLFWYPTMLLKASGLDVFCQDIIENIMFSSIS